MPRSRAGASAFVALALLSCGGDDRSVRVTPPDAGPHGCAVGESVLDDGGCRPPGVPPESCAAGFAGDDAGGCTAVLPAEPCAPGTMALPGETACREVAPCGRAPYGDILVDGTTQFVDASYVGGGSVGSQAKPWGTVQEGVDAAADGAIVAVAAGSYAEDVRVQGKRVLLWGICPAMVEVAGTGQALGAVVVAGGADGTEIHDLAVRGAAQGIVVSGALDVAIERVWIHETAERAVAIDDAYGPTRASLRGSLIESVRELGVFVSGGEATIEGLVIRDVLPRANKTGGRGVSIQDDPTGSPSNVTLRGSVVERSRDAGIYVSGSHAEVVGVLVRDVQPNESNGTAGRGIGIENDGGKGVASDAAVQGVVLERNHEVGLYVSGSSATIEATTVRDTQPRAAGSILGRGIALQDHAAAASIPTVVIRSSLVERSHDIGLAVFGVEASIEGTIVRDTQPLPDQSSGRGIDVETFTLMRRPIVTIRASAVEGSTLGGVVVLGMDAVLGNVAVRDTRPQGDGTFGDGIAVIADVDYPASASIDASRIEASGRAGVSAFGASITLSSTTFECNQIALDGEEVPVAGHVLVDSGDNVCGCGGKTEPCKVVSASLAPPTAVGAQ